MSSGDNVVSVVNVWRGEGERSEEGGGEGGVKEEEEREKRGVGKRGRREEKGRKEGEKGMEGR